MSADNTVPASDSAPAASTTDADILAMAQAADAGLPIPASSPASEQPTPSPTAASVENAPTQQDPNAEPKPEDKAKEKPADPKPEAKAETPYAKAQKERERQQSLLKKFDEEKAAFRREQQAYAQEVEQMRRELAQLKTAGKPAPSGPARDADGITAEAYEQLSKDYEEEGNSRMAEAAREKAKALRAAPPAMQAGAQPATATEAWRTPEFNQKWQAEAAAIVQAEPELGRPENPVFQRVNQLVNDPQYGRLFRADPTGIRAAVQVAKLEQAAAAAEPLRKERDAAQAEVKRLTALLSPRGSHPAAPAPGQKSLDSMTEIEREAYVYAAAAAADRAA